MGYENMWEIVSKSQAKLSEIEFRRNLVACHFGGVTHVPDNDLLARLALYYDTIIIPHPLDLLTSILIFYRKPGFERFQKYLTKRYIHIKEWIDNGIVVLLEIDSEHAQELLQSTLEKDLSDENFERFADNASKKIGSYILLTEHAREFLQSTLGKDFSEEISFRTKLTRDIRSKWTRATSNPEEAVADWLFQGELFQTNQALLTSSITGATPLSDKEYSREFLKYKLERARALGYRMKIPAVLKSTLNIVVPYADKLTVEEIVELRRKRKNPLSRFRARLNDLAMRIKSTPWDNQFEVEVKQIIKEEIIPEVRDIRRQMREIQPNLKGTILKALVSQIPYIGSFVDSYDVIQTWRQKKQLEKNSLYFLALL